MIRSSGHGKDIIDSINDCDKRYVMGRIAMSTPESEEYNRLATHFMIERSRYSFTVKCKGFYGYKNRQLHVKM